MKFTNRQFGELEYEPVHVLQVPEGIIGFGAYRKFLVVNDDDSQPFRWLVSLENPDLSFAMISPDLLVHEYTSTVVRKPGVTVFVMAALKEQPEESTVNLRSPLVIDDATQIGYQTILDDDTLPVRYPLFRSVEAAEEEKAC